MCSLHIENIQLFWQHIKAEYPGGGVSCLQCINHYIRKLKTDNYVLLKSKCYQQTVREEQDTMSVMHGIIHHQTSHSCEQQSFWLLIIVAMDTPGSDGTQLLGPDK